MTPSSFPSFPHYGQSPFLPVDTTPSSYSSLACGSLMEAHDGIPGLQADKSLIRTISNSNQNEGSNVLNPLYCRTESQMDWTRTQNSDLSFAKFEYSYDFSPKNDVYQDMPIRGPSSNVAGHYTFGQSQGTRTSMPLGAGPIISPGYRLHSAQDYGTYQIGSLNELDRTTDERSGAFSRLNTGQGSTVKAQQPSDTPPLAFETPSVITDTSPSQTSDDGGGDGEDENISTIEERISDEPYAKLIHRALLTAPNHSMVLQDIYQWFMDHTDKAHSISSGWKNSIRHNLSMNAAFRKTNRKANGEETKRASEWVLEPFAIKNGVTPTTRYRKSGKSTTSRTRSGKTATISNRKAKLPRQNPQDAHQGMIDDQRGHLPMPYHPSMAVDHSFIPNTPEYHHLSNGSPYSLKELSYDHVMPYGVQVNDGSTLQMHMFAQYENEHPYVLSNTLF